MDREIKYAVMKLLTEIEYDDPITEQLVSVKLTGCAGYIPVFDTIGEAQKCADGKYEIFAVRPVEKE